MGSSVGSRLIRAIRTGLTTVLIKNTQNTQNTQNPQNTPRSHVDWDQSPQGKEDGGLIPFASERLLHLPVEEPEGSATRSKGLRSGPLPAPNPSLASTSGKPGGRRGRRGGSPVSRLCLRVSFCAWVYMQIVTGSTTVLVRDHFYSHPLKHSLTRETSSQRWRMMWTEWRCCEQSHHSLSVAATW